MPSRLIGVAPADKTLLPLIGVAGSNDQGPVGRCGASPPLGLTWARSEGLGSRAMPMTLELTTRKSKMFHPSRK